ncbi:hypothetical protein F5144DRAFT_265974 [Chaetomium tenue]|uniref:Uncharacterized protein n=1 Tax=Chaetomium tenue TaxID=1854479 RepID=A0ACB7P5P8_9PEZI|nr:hypothetical protein F5144DRAFT_265974 [Chaetomium globosum]
MSSSAWFYRALISISWSWADRLQPSPSWELPWRLGCNHLPLRPRGKVVGSRNTLRVGAVGGNVGSAACLDWGLNRCDRKAGADDLSCSSGIGEIAMQNVGGTNNRRIGMNVLSFSLILRHEKQTASLVCFPVAALPRLCANPGFGENWLRLNAPLSAPLACWSGIGELGDRSLGLGSGSHIAAV